MSGHSFALHIVVSHIRHLKLFFRGLISILTSKKHFNSMTECNQFRGRYSSCAHAPNVISSHDKCFCINDWISATQAIRFTILIRLTVKFPLKSEELPPCLLLLSYKGFYGPGREVLCLCCNLWCSVTLGSLTWNHSSIPLAVCVCQFILCVCGGQCSPEMVKCHFLLLQCGLVISHLLQPHPPDLIRKRILCNCCETI